MMSYAEEIVPGWNAPDPHHVFEAAQAESSRKPLQTYMDAIVELRENKGFSFREIAEWLSEIAVKTDHNLVYREYRKHQKKMTERHESEFGPSEINPFEEEVEQETAED